MKSKLFLTVLLLAAALCVMMLFFNGCKKKQVEREVAYRPDNFPEILVPPENAIDVRYINPEFHKNQLGKVVSYSFSYHMVEEYPAIETIEQIRNGLKMKGCIKVEDWGGWRKHRSKTLPDTRWHIQHYWMEIWITPNDGVVNNYLVYKYPEGKEELKKLFVERSVYTASSEWGRIKVPHYKERYPELFEKNQDKETISDDANK